MNQIPNIEETHNTREGIEEILRKFKTTIMWETEHEEGLLMSNHDALEWLRTTLHQQLQKARLEGYEQGKLDKQKEYETTT